MISLQFRDAARYFIRLLWRQCKKQRKMRFKDQTTDIPSLCQFRIVSFGLDVPCSESRLREKFRQWLCLPNLLHASHANAIVWCDAKSSILDHSNWVTNPVRKLLSINLRKWENKKGALEKQDQSRGKASKKTFYHWKEFIFIAIMVSLQDFFQMLTTYLGIKTIHIHMHDHFEIRYVFYGMIFRELKSLLCWSFQWHTSRMNRSSLMVGILMD